MCQAQGYGWDSAMDKMDQDTILKDVATYQYGNSSKAIFTQWMLEFKLQAQVFWLLVHWSSISVILGISF